MVTEAEIVALVEATSRGELEDYKDVWLSSGMSGDDWYEFIDEFAETYSIKMDNYKWYYHGDEEGLFNFGGLFYPPPQDQVTRIPISVADLVRIAINGVWDLNYPSKIIDLRRRDLKINRVLFLLIFALLILIITSKIFY